MLFRPPTGIKGSRVSISSITAAFSSGFAEGGLRGDICAAALASASMIVLGVCFTFLEGLAGVVLEGPAPLGDLAEVAPNSVLVHFSTSAFLKKYLVGSPAYVNCCGAIKSCLFSSNVKLKLVLTFKTDNPILVISWVVTNDLTFPALFALGRLFVRPDPGWNKDGIALGER